MRIPTISYTSTTNNEGHNRKLHSGEQWIKRYPVLSGREQRGAFYDFVCPTHKLKLIFHLFYFICSCSDITRFISVFVRSSIYLIHFNFKGRRMYAFSCSCKRN
uniref:Uncharacterized protein n=1 Tax=Trypanosoma vivax (strain Y486) TaxID=1055687 RepID=G0U1K8_TRYVY|nr:hypothetical protein, unlikely [Trypanosoma vivax Y486]